jgi:hypothetical protein
MHNLKRWIMFIGFIILILIIPTPLFGEEAQRKSRRKSDTKSDFVLTIEDGLISLDAKDALLKQIVEEIGSKMKIDVIIRVPEEMKITTKFDGISLKDAIERLRGYADIIYFRDSDSDKKITKIMAFPKRI